MKKLVSFYITKPLIFRLILDKDDAYKNDYFVVVTPTDYNPKLIYFNMTSIKNVIEE